ncbi:hypothetical protein IE077_002016, partial [Cardiosporidium cionae]
EGISGYFCSALCAEFTHLCFDRPWRKKAAGCLCLIRLLRILPPLWARRNLTRIAYAALHVTKDSNYESGRLAEALAEECIFTLICVAFAGYTGSTVEHIVGPLFASISLSESSLQTSQSTSSPEGTHNDLFEQERMSMKMDMASSLDEMEDIASSVSQEEISNSKEKTTSSTASTGTLRERSIKREELQKEDFTTLDAFLNASTPSLSFTPLDEKDPIRGFERRFRPPGSVWWLKRSEHITWEGLLKLSSNNEDTATGMKAAALPDYPTLMEFRENTWKLMRNLLIVNIYSIKESSRFVSKRAFLFLAFILRTTPAVLLNGIPFSEIDSTESQASKGTSFLQSNPASSIVSEILTKKTAAPLAKESVKWGAPLPAASSSNDASLKTEESFSSPPGDTKFFQTPKPPSRRYFDFGGNPSNLMNHLVKPLTLRNVTCLNALWQLAFVEAMGFIFSLRPAPVIKPEICARPPSRGGFPLSSSQPSLPGRGAATTSERTMESAPLPPGPPKSAVEGGKSPSSLAYPCPLSPAKEQLHKQVMIRCIRLLKLALLHPQWASVMHIPRKAAKLSTGNEETSLSEQLESQRKTKLYLPSLDLDLRTHAIILLLNSLFHPKMEISRAAHHTLMILIRRKKQNPNDNQSEWLISNEHIMMALQPTSYQLSNINTLTSTSLKAPYLQGLAYLMEILPQRYNSLIGSYLFEHFKLNFCFKNRPTDIPEGNLSENGQGGSSLYHREAYFSKSSSLATRSTLEEERFYSLKKESSRDMHTFVEAFTKSWRSEEISTERYMRREYKYKEFRHSQSLVSTIRKSKSVYPQHFYWPALRAITVVHTILKYSPEWLYTDFITCSKTHSQMDSYRANEDSRHCSLIEELLNFWVASFASIYSNEHVEMGRSSTLSAGRCYGIGGISSNENPHTFVHYAEYLHSLSEARRGMAASIQ